jgi:hypothetical protein
VRAAPIVLVRRSAVVELMGARQPVVRRRSVHGHVCSMVVQRGETCWWLLRKSVIAFSGPSAEDWDSLTPPECGG